MRQRAHRSGNPRRATTRRNRHVLPSIARALHIFVTVIALATLGTTGVHAAPAKANDLVKDMKKGTAFIGKAVKQIGTNQLSPRKERQKPFFAALKKTNGSLKSLTKAVAAKNDKVFQKSLDRTGKSIKESHTGMKVKEEHLTAFIEDLTATLDKINDGEREKAEVLAAFNSMKDDDVQPLPSVVTFRPTELVG